MATTLGPAFASLLTALVVLIASHGGAEVAIEGDGFNDWVENVVNSTLQGRNHTLVLHEGAAEHVAALGYPIAIQDVPGRGLAPTVSVDAACPPSPLDAGIDESRERLQGCVRGLLPAIGGPTVEFVCHDNPVAEIETFYGGFHGDIDPFSREGEPILTLWFNECSTFQSKSLACANMPSSSADWTCDTQTEGTITQVALEQPDFMITLIDDDPGTCCDDTADISPVLGGSELQLTISEANNNWLVTNWKSSKSPTDCGTGRALGNTCTVSGHDDGTNGDQDAYLKVTVANII